MKSKRLCFIILMAALLLLLLAFTIIVFFSYHYFESFDTSDDSVQLVIARYNEDLSWIHDAPFNKFKHIIYNKSDNSNFQTSSKTVRVVDLPNVGRCDHTYLYHVIHSYDRLSDITVFLPGSLSMEGKRKKATHLLEEIQVKKQNVFLGTKYDNVQKTLYEFKLDDWKASDTKNSSLNSEQRLTPAPLRPFGKWFGEVFGNVLIDYVSYYGIFSVDRREILQHPKSYYESLIQPLEVSSNPEVGHYFERSWNAVFHPMSHTLFFSFDGGASPPQNE